MLCTYTMLLVASIWFVVLVVQASMYFEVYRQAPVAAWTLTTLFSVLFHFPLAGIMQDTEKEYFHIIIGIVLTMLLLLSMPEKDPDHLCGAIFAGFLLSLLPLVEGSALIPTLNAIIWISMVNHWTGVRLLCFIAAATLSTGMLLYRMQWNLVLDFLLLVQVVCMLSRPFPTPGPPIHDYVSVYQEEQPSRVNSLPQDVAVDIPEFEVERDFVTV